MRIMVSIVIFVLGLYSFAYASDSDIYYAAVKFAAEYEQELREKAEKRYEWDEVELQEHTWDLGTELSYIKYEEPDVMEEEGMMCGIVGSYTYRGCLPLFLFPTTVGKYMLKVEGRSSWGQVNYKNSGTLEGINDSMVELRGLGGYGFPILTASILTPYIGFGYRYLNDDMSGKVTSTGALGYERESNYFYSPIGIETITELDNGWSVGLTVEYDYFWKGIQKSHLSDARCYDPVVGYYTFNDVENDQDKGYGIRGSMKFQRKGEKLDFLIGPYIRYWNIKKSKEVTTSTISENGLWIVTGTFVEPKNKSTEIGVKAAIKF